MITKPNNNTESTWVINSIDKFILSELKKQDLAPSPEADKRTLIRRLYLDLTGLPPTIKDIDKFLYYGHMINDGIHEYEPHLVSERSHELKDEGFYGVQIFNHWRDATNKQGLIVSPSEVETSYQHFLDCDVYIDSNIFGKPYLDTYLENDPPLEYDVNNVEVISGISENEKVKVWSITKPNKINKWEK